MAVVVKVEALLLTFCVSTVVSGETELAIAGQVELE